MFHTARIKTPFNIICNHSNDDHFMCAITIKFSHIKFSCFFVKTHLVFNWCLYNNISAIIITVVNL